MIGSALGLLLAHWSVELLVRLSPIEIPRRNELGRGLPVFLGAAGLCGLTTLFFSAGPAVWLVRQGLGATNWLAGRRSVTGSHHEFTIMRTLLAFQAAVCLVLVVAAGLLVKTTWVTSKVDPGFNGNHVLSVMLLPPRAQRGAPFADFAMHAIQTLASLGGVTAVGGTSHFPVVTGGWASESIIPEHPQVGEQSAALPVEHRVVTPDFFRAMDISLLRGRPFTWQDGATTQEVVVVSRSVAQRMWPSSDPVGRSVRYERTPDDKPMTVVGVVNDVNDFGADTPLRDTIYRPIGQGTWGNTTLFVALSVTPPNWQAASGKNFSRHSQRGLDCEGFKQCRRHSANRVRLGGSI